MIEHVLDAIEWKRTHPADDLLTALIDAEDDGDRLSADELVDQVIAAVHRRPRDDRQPDRQRHARAAAQPRAARTVAATTRRSTPTRSTSCCATTRRCSSRAASPPPTLEVDGADHRARARSCSSCLGAANRDPAHWGDDADALDLTRAGAAQHLAFGSAASTTAWARRWPGSRAAIAIGTLVRRFPGLELATDAPAWNGRLVAPRPRQPPGHPGLTPSAIGADGPE